MGRVGGGVVGVEDHTAPLTAQQQAGQRKHRKAAFTPSPLPRNRNRSSKKKHPSRNNHPNIC